MSKYAKVVLVARQSCPIKKSFPNLPAQNSVLTLTPSVYWRTPGWRWTTTPDGDVAVGVVYSSFWGRMGKLPACSHYRGSAQTVLFSASKNRNGSRREGKQTDAGECSLVRFVKASISGNLLGMSRRWKKGRERNYERELVSVRGSNCMKNT